MKHIAYLLMLICVFAFGTVSQASTLAPEEKSYEQVVGNDQTAFEVENITMVAMDIVMIKSTENENKLEGNYFTAQSIKPDIFELNVPKNSYYVPPNRFYFQKQLVPNNTTKRKRSRTELIQHRKLFS